MQVITPESALERKPASGMRRYLLSFASIWLLGAALLGAELKLTFFSTNSTEASYRDLGGRRIPQIQDEDVFYHNFGNSIAAAKAADIVLLGPSFVGFAIDRDTLRSSLLAQLKIYNMAFIGIRSGEFSRRLINRWDMHAPLWIINIDDQEQHFFSDNLNASIGGGEMPIGAVQRNWINADLTVAGREIRWQIEEMMASIQAGDYSAAGLYRNVSNGDLLLSTNPSYLANHKPVPLARNPNCHTNTAVVKYAREFLKEAGGNVVFMLVPHSNVCVRQATELASELNIELIAPPYEGFTTFDNGGHLDKNGAEKFTRYLAAELVKTQAFKRTFAQKIHQFEITLAPR
jgi:hypothetical protein